MKDIIDISIFIQYLTYYIKIAIFINKGTEDETILHKCIELYNLYKTIESTISEGISAEDNIIIRKCWKTLNLILKTNADGKPIDIRKKDNQRKILTLSPHESIKNDDIKQIITHATTYNINIFTNVPLMFVLRESKYRELLWQYTRCLFTLSQILASNVKMPNNEQSVSEKNIVSDSVTSDTLASDISISVSDTSDKKQNSYKSNDNKQAIKMNLFNESMVLIEQILEQIALLEDNTKLDQLMSVDKYLNIKLIKTGINEKSIEDAKKGVKEMFIKKGIQDNSMSNIIDSISDKLVGADFSNGHLIQNMIGIAQNVACEMKDDLATDPDKFQDTLGAITEVFRDAMNDNDKNGGEVPPELRNMFNSIIDTNNGDVEASTNEITKNLENIIVSQGMDREEFFNNIQDENGNVNISNIEKIFSQMN